MLTDEETGALTAEEKDALAKQELEDHREVVKTVAAVGLLTRETDCTPGIRERILARLNHEENHVYFIFERIGKDEIVKARMQSLNEAMPDDDCEWDDHRLLVDAVAGMSAEELKALRERVLQR